MTKRQRPARHEVPITVSNEEREALERLSRRPRSNRHLALRAKLVLASASGLADTAVAATYNVNRKTVACWRVRFAERRLDGLYDEPRVGAPRQITDEQVEAMTG